MWLSSCLLFYIKMIAQMINFQNWNCESSSSMIIHEKFQNIFDISNNHNLTSCQYFLDKDSIIWNEIIFVLFSSILLFRFCVNILIFVIKIQWFLGWNIKKISNIGRKHSNMFFVKVLSILNIRDFRSKIRLFCEKIEKLF